MVFDSLSAEAMTWQRVRQQWPYVGRYSANGFHTSGVSQIRLCRENKVMLLPWTNMGHSLKCLFLFARGTGRGLQQSTT